MGRSQSALCCSLFVLRSRSPRFRDLGFLPLVSLIQIVNREHHEVRANWIAREILHRARCSYILDT